MRITVCLVTLLLCLAPEVSAQGADINSAAASVLERIAAEWQHAVVEKGGFTELNVQ